jgi:salicylate hydroxylase
MPDVPHTSQSLQVLIVGGGLGGAAAAVALSLAGCKVTMLEGASRLSEVSVSIYRNRLLLKQVSL